VCACVCVPTTTRRDYTVNLCVCVVSTFVHSREVGGWGRVPFSKNLMSPTPRRKWCSTTGRRAHYMVLDPIPQSLPVHFFGSRSQPPTSRTVSTQSCVCDRQLVCLCSVVVFICVKKTDVMNQKVHKLCVCVSV